MLMNWAQRDRWATKIVLVEPQPLAISSTTMASCRIVPPEPP